MWLALLFASASLHAESGLAGRVLDPQGKAVPLATVRVSRDASAVSDGRGEFRIQPLAPGKYRVTVEAAAFQPAFVDVTVGSGAVEVREITLSGLARQHESIVIEAKTVEPALDLRNREIFDRTLFSRDDQIMQELNAGIDAGQHEGGGKSLEIRRFGFNLDHGGVNGGLKVLIDGVQQNQETQGHGQGYLGSLKALSPELIQDVTIVNGPFSAEYGDFSGLGVVHIRQRESLPDEFTVRMQAGSFGTRRGFLAYSPDIPALDSYIAYEGSYTNGPFQNAGRYRRDNINANATKSLPHNQKLGVRLLGGRNDFYSSGQLPLDLVDAGALDRFGYIDPSDGGRVRLGTGSVYYSRARSTGDSFKSDAFVSRSLFDLYSNFTYFLTDPVHGDAFQQHDSRIQQGANVQYTHVHAAGPFTAILVSGGNFHHSGINVGLYPRAGRVPTGVTTRANAHVTNGAGYAQENLSLLHGRLLIGAGLRFDEFRFGVADRLHPEDGGGVSAGRWQSKASAAYTPTARLPFTLTANYGRGINSSDARAVVQRPDAPRVATTDFYQAGAASNSGRFGVSVDAFLIDHSHEQVYIPDDGSFEFNGPTRSYGYEAKTSFSVTRHVSLSGGLTKIANAFYRGGEHRVYVASAPHFVANAALTLAGWRGWIGSLRMRAINHYRLDTEDSAIVASGHTVFDASVSRPLRRGVELSFSFDNLTNRDYYETQNFFESRVAPMAPIVARIHATPAYPLTAVIGLTFRLRSR